MTSGALDTTFEEILGLILGNVFVPVSGDNDAGVGDSVTYQDPIGEYMEIKNGAINATPYHTDNSLANPQPTDYDMALLLFGEMHGLTRAGVYDFQWNDAWIAEHDPSGQGTAAMVEGWYLGDDPADAKSGGSGEIPDADGDGKDDYDTATAARAAGWVYRLNFRTVQDYVPILGETLEPKDLPDQVKNTVYTVYCFNCDATDRDKLRRNPIYGEVPDKAQEIWDALGGDYPNNTYDVPGLEAATYPGLYRLNDIRVWVEDTGDFVDEDGRITPNTGYDRSLYVNIPAAAIPTELATITLGKDGVLSYETNLGKDHPVGSQITVEEDGKTVTKPVTEDDFKSFCYQSTPFRLFYAVGLEDDLILWNEDRTQQTGVDFNAISPEYLQSHTDAENHVWFISNYYSGTRYSGYATDDVSRTRGDPTVTFSPGADNRYYVFQKPLPLYAHAYRANGSDLTPVDKQDGKEWTSENNRAGNGATTWEDDNTGGASWGGGQYIGTYDDAAAFKAAVDDMEPPDSGGKQYITDSNGIKYEYVKDGIVFLQEDLLEHVTSKSDAEGGGYAEGSISFSSDDYYFILLEFYVPYPGTTGKDNEDNTVYGTQAGHMVQYALARKGSEFGSGFASDNINNGDMLCWTDVQNHLNVEFAYLSKTDTGDLTRGEPTFERLTYKDGGPGDTNLRTYLQNTCGIKDTKVLDEQVAYWTKMQEDPQVIAALEAAAQGNPVETLTREQFNAYFQFAVATRPGGIRSGDMSNNLQYKGTAYDTTTQLYNNNVTQTSNTYYLPTVSDNSGTDNDVIINNYLGNNGRLEIANEMLHVTKLLQPPEGYTLTEGQEDETFNFQVYVQGVTGKRTAVRTEYNESSGTWERELAYIDVLTDNSDLVQTNDSTRAVFVWEDGAAKQVVQDGDDWYYAKEDGTLPTDDSGAADASQKVSDPEPLYYMYLPASSSGTDTQHVRRLYQSEDYTGADADDFKDGLLSNGMDTAADGTKTYSATDAELIPVDEVKAAESISLEGDPGAGAGPSPIALESSGGGWTHNGDSSTHGSHIGLSSYTFFTRRPSAGTSATNFISPYKTRTQYLTVELNFGYNANADDGSADTTSKLTQADLYDTEPLNGMDAEDIAKNTAEFTLHHGEGLLLTGLDENTDYRFTEKLTAEQVAKGYTL